MSFRLEGPFEGPQTALLLPDPDLDDTEGQDLSVNFRQSMNGTFYSYVKTSERRRLTFTWSDIGRGKIVEIQQFYRNYAGSNIKLVDHDGDIWKVIFAVDPTDSTINFRSSNQLQESGQITLEFLGAKIA